MNISDFRLGPKMKGSIAMRRGLHCFVGLLLACAGGCGPDPEVVAKQEEQRKAEYQRQKQPAPKRFRITPQEEAIRQERLKMEYGDFEPR